MRRQNLDEIIADKMNLIQATMLRLADKELSASELNKKIKNEASALCILLNEVVKSETFDDVFDAQRLAMSKHMEISKDVSRLQEMNQELNVLRDSLAQFRCEYDEILVEHEKLSSCMSSATKLVEDLNTHHTVVEAIPIPSAPPLPES